MVRVRDLHVLTMYGGGVVDSPFVATDPDRAPLPLTPREACGVLRERLSHPSRRIQS